MSTDFTICPYCGGHAELVGGRYVYPRRPDLHHKMFWYCDNGHPPAYVGCHDGTAQPLGRLADSRLRKAKRDAHQALDWLWQDGHMSRGAVYAWLAEQLGMSKDECHIGYFDVETCNRVIDLGLSMIGGEGDG